MYNLIMYKNKSNNKRQILLLICLAILIFSKSSTGQSNNSNETFILSDLFACGSNPNPEERADTRFPNCGKIVNLFIPRNNSLKCLDPQLELEFDIFAPISCEAYCDRNNSNETEDSSIETHTRENTAGYLRQINGSDESQSMFIYDRHEKLEDNKHCKIIKK